MSDFKNFEVYKNETSPRIKLLANLEEWFRPKKVKNTEIYTSLSGSLLIDDFTLRTETGINCFINASNRQALEALDGQEGFFNTPFGVYKVFFVKIEPLQSNFIDYLKYNIEMVVIQS